MREIWIAIVLLAGLANVGWGQAEDGAPFFEKVRKKHYDPRADGLAAFKAVLTLKEASDPELKELRDELRIHYSWREPDKEGFAVQGVDEARREPLRQTCQGLWKDLTGTFVFDLLKKAKKLQYSIKRGDAWLVGFNSPEDMCAATFDQTSLVL
ncbi:MAG: hypothetical protein ACYS47_21365, partial [Planctomycetota bacterium]